MGNGLPCTSKRSSQLRDLLGHNLRAIQSVVKVILPLCAIIHEAVLDSAATSMGLDQGCVETSLTALLITPD